MSLIIALLFGLLAYYLVSLLVSKLPRLSGNADTIGIIAGIIVALWSLGAVVL